MGLEKKVFFSDPTQKEKNSFSPPPHKKKKKRSGHETTLISGYTWELEHNTNLLSLCNESFLTDIRIDSLSSDDDNLSTTKLDDYITEPFDIDRWQPFDGGSD